MRLSSLGRLLAALPLDVHLAKMLIYSAIFGCLDPILTISAAMSVKSPFVAPMNKRADAQRAYNSFCTESSDDLGIVKVRLSYHSIYTILYHFLTLGLGV